MWICFPRTTMSFNRTKQRHPEKVEIRVLDKKNGTQFINQSLFKADGPMLSSMKLNMMRLLSPLELKKIAKDLSISSNEKFYIITMKVDELTSEYYVSKKTYLIEEVKGKLKIDSNEMIFLTQYKDYENFNGLMVAHTEIKFAGGINTAIFHLKETRYKKPIGME